MTLFFFPVICCWFRDTHTSGLGPGHDTFPLQEAGETPNNISDIHLVLKTDLLFVFLSGFQKSDRCSLVGFFFHCVSSGRKPLRVTSMLVKL